MKKYILLIVLILLSSTIYGQKHDWSLGIFSNTNQTSIRNNNGGIATDSSGNTYVIGSYRGSLIVGTDTINSGSGVDASFVSKYDKDGNFIWVKNLAFASIPIILNQIKINHLNQIVFYGWYRRGSSSAGVLVFGNDTLQRVNYNAFAALMDTTGNFISGANLFTSSSGIDTYGLEIAENNDILVSGYHSFTRSVLDSGADVSVGLSTIANTLVCRFSPDGKRLRWFEPIRLDLADIERSLAISSDNQVYFGVRVAPNRTQYSISTGSEPRLALVWLDGENGNFKKAKGADNTNIASIASISAIDSNQIFIHGAAIRDSAAWNGLTFYKVGSTSITGGIFNYCLFIQQWDSVGWHITSNVNNITSAASTIGSYKEGNETYFFLSISNLNINRDSFDFGGFRVGYASSYLTKIDSRSNVLWVIPTPGLLPCWMSSSDGDILYARQTQLNTAIFDPDTIFNNISFRNWIFLARTIDYTITRGEVFPGPYCAGDSISIPYTKKGVYDTSNFFIAEISDAAGRFLGGEKEIGRIKTTEDSVVRGLLPQFQVFSSGNYRIRIRSTNPVVQSFFRTDSLKLLIYSTDKADPGPDEVLCKGKGFMLNTFGGTKWEWSPALYMDDSTLRSPTIFPLQSTTYRIVISDSSGCGEADTAFKRIIVKETPTITLQSDTILACHNLDIQIPATFKNGDTSAYRWTWFNLANPQQWQLIKADSFKVQDAITFRLPSSNDSFQRIALVLTDSCSSFFDTAYCVIQLRNVTIKNNITQLDTLLCFRKLQKLSAQVTHNFTNQIQYRWFWENTSNDWVLQKNITKQNLGDTFNFSGFFMNPTQNRIMVLTRDLCTPFFDTSFYVLNIDQSQPILSNLPKDTVVCPKYPVRFNPQIIGNSSFGYNWLLSDSFGNLFSFGNQSNSNTIDIDFTPTFNNKSITLILSVFDNCSPNKDTATLTFFAPSPIQAAILNETRSVIVADTLEVCNGNELVFYAKGIGGDSNNYSYKWIKIGPHATGNMEIVGTDASLVFIPNEENYKKLLLEISDDCLFKKDTVSVTFTYKPPLKATILKSNNMLANDTLICQGSALIFNAIGNGGDSQNYHFQWLIDDNLLSENSQFSYQSALFNKQNSASQTLKLVLKDSCMIPNDTTQIIILTKPKLQANIVNQETIFPTDTTLCLGSNLSLYGKGKGGDSTQYSYEWYWDDSLIGNKMELYLALTEGGKSNRLSFILKDNCSTPDTFILHLTTLPALNVQFTAPDTVCTGETIVLNAQALGGKESSYVFQWRLNDSFFSDDKDINISLIQQIQPSIIQLILSDGCSSSNDTFSKTIVTRPPLDITLAASTLCANPSSLLTATPIGGKGSQYLIEWLDETNTLLGSGNTFVASPTKPSIYSAQLSDGCSADKALAQIRIDKFPSTLTLTALPTEGCEPLPVTFEFQTNYSLAYSTRMHFGTPDSATGLNGVNKFTYPKAGNYLPRIDFIGEGGCSATITGPVITVYPKPQAAFSYLPNKPNLNNPKVSFKNLSSGANSFIWNIDPFGEFPDFEPEVTYLDSGKFAVQLIAFSDKGCSDTVNGELVVKDLEQMFLPTAFSPNGDGLNDVLEPELKGYNLIDFTIFNRWGERIFSSKAQGWDGTYRNSPAPVGVYTYTILLEDQDGNRRLFSGNVTLLR